jgi:hypothetical protein
MLPLNLYNEMSKATNGLDYSLPPSLPMVLQDEWENRLGMLIPGDPLFALVIEMTIRRGISNIFYCILSSVLSCSLYAK